MRVPENLSGHLRFSLAAAPPAEESPSGETRPQGLTIIPVVWGLFAVYNIFYSVVTARGDLGAWQSIDASTVDPWFHFGIPVELTLSVIFAAFGFVQLATAYGLLRKKRWAYFSGLALPILVAVISGAFFVLYYSAPPSLELSPGVYAPFVVAGIFWTYVMWNYLRKPHIKAFMGVEPAKSGEART